MPGQASPQLSLQRALPAPVFVAIGAGAMAVSGIDRAARSIAGPLWRLARAAPGVSAPLDASLALLAQTGATVAGRAVELAETLTRGLLRAALPIVFDELGSNARLDLTGLVLRAVDLDAIAAEIDLEAIITRLDLPALVHRIVSQLDLTTLVLEHVDLDAIAAGLDLDGVIAQVDIDKVVASVDLDAAVHRVDLLGIANEIIDGVNLTEIIRESTGALSTDAVHGVRSRGADADSAVSGFVDRLLGRGDHEHPHSPQSGDGS